MSELPNNSDASLNSAGERKREETTRIPSFFNANQFPSLNQSVIVNSTSRLQNLLADPLGKQPNLSWKDRIMQDHEGRALMNRIVTPYLKDKKFGRNLTQEQVEAKKGTFVLNLLTQVNQRATIAQKIQKADPAGYLIENNEDVRNAYSAYDKASRGLANLDPNSPEYEDAKDDVLLKRGAYYAKQRFYQGRYDPKRLGPSGSNINTDLFLNRDDVVTMTRGELSQFDNAQQDWNNTFSAITERHPQEVMEGNLSAYIANHEKKDYAQKVALMYSIWTSTNKPETLQEFGMALGLVDKDFVNKPAIPLPSEVDKKADWKNELYQIINEKYLPRIDEIARRYPNSDWGENLASEALLTIAYQTAIGKEGDPSKVSKKDIRNALIEIGDDFFPGMDVPLKSFKKESFFNDFIGGERETMSVSTNLRSIGKRHHDKLQYPEEMRTAFARMGNLFYDVDHDEGNISREEQMRLLNALIHPDTPDSSMFGKVESLSMIPKKEKNWNHLTAHFWEDGLNPLGRTGLYKSRTLTGGQKISLFDVKSATTGSNKMTEKDIKTISKMFSSDTGIANQIAGSLLQDFSLASTFKNVSQLKVGISAPEARQAIMQIFAGQTSKNIDNHLKAYQEAVEKASGGTKTYIGNRAITELKNLQIAVNQELLNNHTKIVKYSGDNYGFALKTGRAMSQLNFLKNKNGDPILLHADDILDIHDLVEEVSVGDGDINALIDYGSGGGRRPF